MDMVYPDFYFLKCYCIEIEHSRHRDSISLIKINGGGRYRLAISGSFYLSHNRYAGERMSGKEPKQGRRDRYRSRVRNLTDNATPLSELLKNRETKNPRILKSNDLMEIP